MSAPIRPPSPRITENDVVIHRSKSYYDRTSPLCTFISCLSPETVDKLVTVTDTEIDILENLDTPICDDKDGPTLEQYVAASRWIKEHEIVSGDAFMKKVREKQFGNVMKSELNLPKRK